MSDTPDPSRRTEDALAACDALRLSLLHAESRLLTLRRSENHERVLRVAAEQVLQQADAAPALLESAQRREREGAERAAERERALQDAIADRDAALATLRQHLLAFEQSAIWRATWPLRRALDRSPRLARAGRRMARAGWWTLTLQWPRRLRERAEWRVGARVSAGVSIGVDAGAGTGAIGAAPGRIPPDQPLLAAPAWSDAASALAHAPVPGPVSGEVAGLAPEPLPGLVAGPDSGSTSGHAPVASPDRDAPLADAVDPGLSLPTSPTPLVSVIVPCFGQVAVTLRCLRAIAASETVLPFEVIVAEDASGDAEVETLALVGGLVLLRNPANLGFLENCNQAALHARGRYLLFLNNDTEPLPGFLDALVRAIEAVTGAGLVGARLLFPDGRLQEAGGIVWQDGTGWNYGRGDDPERPEYNTLRDTDYVSGACMLLARDLFEALDGFDPVFAPAYYEDTDLAFRIRARGLRVLVQPASLVVHHEGLSHGIDISSGIKAQQEINRHRFVARWPKLLAREHFPPGEQPMRAAEHARGRPTILVIDHYVPEPDRDAGSRSTMAILRALREAGWVVRFWPANRVRNDYTVLLECMGIVVLDHRVPFGFDDWIGREGHGFDHALVMRPTVAPEFLSGLMTRTRARLSFYGHDVHHLRMRRQATLGNDDALAREADAMERRERALWALFDTVLYPSAIEADLVRALVPNANAHAIVPFAFDRFPARTTPPAGRIVLFVAGFAHPPNIDAAAWLAGEILPLLRRQVPDVLLVLAGSHPTREVLALEADGITVTGTLDEAGLEARYGEARAAVVPLRVGAGVKGKVVEALAKGLPLVTTPIGAEGMDGLEHVVAVEREPERIAAGLAVLLTDDRVWMERSARQLDYAARCFSRRALSDSVFAALATAP